MVNLSYLVLLGFVGLNSINTNNDVKTFKCSDTGVVLSDVSLGNGNNVYFASNVIVTSNYSVTFLDNENYDVYIDSFDLSYFFGVEGLTDSERTQDFTYNIPVNRVKCLSVENDVITYQAYNYMYIDFVSGVYSPTLSYTFRFYVGDGISPSNSYTVDTNAIIDTSLNYNFTSHTVVSVNTVNIDRNTSIVGLIDFVIGGYDSDVYYRTGYNNGYNEGYNVGINEGYNSGSTEGYNNGYTVGFGEGYNEGFNEGFETDSTATTIFSGILQVALTPINMFLTMFNFSILGIDVAGLVASILSFALTIVIVKETT